MDGGRAFVFGDRVDTDALAPGRLMALEPAALAQHCLETLDPGFARAVRPGDFVVAGESFGCGSSREQAAVSLQLLGVRAVIAQSFARIFYRNCFNIGLPALIVPDAGAIAAGDALALDLVGGVLENRTRARLHAFAPVPPHLLALIAAGGLLPLLAQRLAQERGQG